MNHWLLSEQEEMRQQALKQVQLAQDFAQADR